MFIHKQEENNPFEVEGLFCFPTKRRPRTQIGWENFLGLATLLYSHALQLPLMPPQEQRVGQIEMVFFIDNKQRKRSIDQDRKQLLEFSRDKRLLSKNTKREMGNKEKIDPQMQQCKWAHGSGSHHNVANVFQIFVGDCVLQVIILRLGSD